MNTEHKIVIGNSQNLEDIRDESVDLVVTSPPYPMVEMWDSLFISLNPLIKEYLDENNGGRVYYLIWEELDKVYMELARVIKPGGIICINIGDATRKIGRDFQSYPNHSHTIEFFTKQGLQVLPEIIWRKKSNKPNKFMGSGMLPPNAYITQEHEYILIFRKQGNRQFTTKGKPNRYSSAYFFEERNKWFTDLWTDITGTPQKMNGASRKRNGAYPLEIPYRLINMFSVKGDTILDPFLGTGTTMTAAILHQRNSIGYEIDSSFKEVILENIKENLKKNNINNYRLENHLKNQKDCKYESQVYDFQVKTRQETKLKIPEVKDIKIRENNLITRYN